MLHTVNKSPFEKNSLDTCLRLSKAGSHVLFIEDGVYGALAGAASAPQVRAHLPSKHFYALDADLAARGITQAQLISGIMVVGYGEFVDLAQRCGAVQAWF